MENKVNRNAGLLGAFFAGQAVMLGLVLLFRAAPAGAQATEPADPDVVTAKTVVVRADSKGPGMQLSAVGAGGGPSFSLFDASGGNRIQLSVDAKGKPTVILRDKAGAVAVGVGLDNDAPVIAVRTAGGKLAPLPLPKDAAGVK